MVDAYREEKEQFWENARVFLAWHAANVMNSHFLKKPIDMNKLLGKDTSSKPSNTSNNQTLSKEERKKKLEELKKEFGFK